MSSQLFKNKIPYDTILNIFEKYLLKEKDIFIFNKYVFKKMILDDKLHDFCNEVKNYYHKSKKGYIDKEHNYKTIATILRQICKYHDIVFTSKIKYLNSGYETVYSINL